MLAGFLCTLSLRQFEIRQQFLGNGRRCITLRDRGLSYLLNLYAGIKALLGPETTMGLRVFDLREWLNMVDMYGKCR